MPQPQPPGQPPQMSAADLAKLIDLYKKIDGLTESAAKNAADFANQQGRAVKELARLEKEWSDLTKNISGTREAFASIVDEIKGMSSGIGRATVAFRGLESLASKLQYHQQGLNRLSANELETLKKKAKQKIGDLELAAKIEKSELTRLLLKQRRQGLDNNETAKLNQVKTTLNNINEQLFANINAYADFNHQLDHSISIQKKIEKSLGVTGALIKGISKIPFLGDLPGMSGILKEVEEDIAEIERTEGRIVGKTEAMGMAFKKMGKGLIETLQDPLTSITLMIKLFKEFLNVGFAADKRVVDLGKGLAMSKNEAKALNEHFGDITRETGNSANEFERLFITQQKLAEATFQLGKAFGAMRGFTDAQLKDQIKLTKLYGMEEESAAGLQQLALANKITADDVVDATIKQTASLAKQTGIQLDNRKILNEVAKVSGQLRLQYKNNPELIAQAVVQTEKLGISLEKAKGMANSLLQFEDSISAELEAELLTGKQINLEQARLLALNGKTAEAATEISKQIGSSAEYSALNVLQQDAYARALGMSADELADMLLYNENINNLGASTKSQIEEQIALAKQKGDMERVAYLERSVGDEASAKAALEEVDAQNKFNEILEKGKQILASFIEGPAIELVEMLSNVGDLTDRIVSAVTLIGIGFGAIKLAGLIGQLSAIASTTGVAAAGAITYASGITLAIGIAAVVAGIAAAMGAFSSSKQEAAKIPIGDGMIAPDGGLMVSGKKGTYQLDKNDTVIAGTGLGKSVQDATIASNGELMEEKPKDTYQSNNKTEKEKEKETKVIAKGGEVTLTIDGKAFAKLIAPYVFVETSLIGMAIGALQ